MKCSKCHFENPADTLFCGQCGTRLPHPEESFIPTRTFQIPLKELNVGSTVAGRFQVIEDLGKGGMGRVYKVLDKEINEKVALKLLNPEIAADEKMVNRFRNELRLARNITHRNVCRMHDLGKSENTFYITMEFVSGEDLRSFRRRVRRLPMERAISIGKQICEGLEEAHKQGVVHRDLKPQNIMIDKEGNVKIMDFGIARLMKAKGITEAGYIVGTPEYMSPEQVEGKEADQRSDIYSLGVILYEMATEKLPFEGETPFSVALKHKTEAPPNPKEINAQIPEELSRVILRCLEKEKEKRYQSAAELISEFSKIEKEILTSELAAPLTKGTASKEIKVSSSLRRLFPTALIFIVIAIIGVMTWRFLYRKEAKITYAAKHSIAVLPFVDLSPKKEHEYLCDGMTETLIDALTKIKDLRVPARTSSFFFKDREQDIREIGKKLNVETLLEGSVQVVGERLRIATQLINVEDGYHLWSERYERKLGDVFAIQDDIAQTVVKTLKVDWLGEKDAPLVRAHTKSRQAYDLYLKARYYWNRRTEDGFKKAIELFQQAIAKDPTYAQAYSGLADSYTLSSRYGMLSPNEAYPKAKPWIMKALELDETLAEAHTSLAFMKLFYDWDWQGAEREFRRACELNPKYPSAHHWYSHYFMAMGMAEESLVESKLALESDPLDLALNTHLGYHYYYTRQYNEAIEQLLKTLEMEPSFARAYYYLGLVYMQVGKCDESLLELEKALNLSKGQTAYKSSLGQAYARCGRRSEARAITEELKKLSAQIYIPALEIAFLHLSLGEKDQAFEWLGRACQEHDAGIHTLKVDPRLDDLRSDPRFAKLLKKVGLET